jgi:hypothetical protein
MLAILNEFTFMFLQEKLLRAFFKIIFLEAG